VTNEQLIWSLTAALALLLLFFTWHYRRRYVRLLETISLVTIDDFPSRHLGNTRPIYVFLPPNYSLETDRHYRVLYVNDGQDMALLNLRYTVAHLCAARRIQPIIVVAIPTNEDRLHEYGTAVTVNAQGLGSKAAAYTRFLVEEVRPVIDQEFRASRGPEHTAILGASLGGLSAFDIAWNHPEVFGTVGVFSGSFWWRAAAVDLQITPNALIMPEVVRRSQKREGFRAWFQAATRDEVCDRDGNGVIDAIQDTLELMAELALLGYRPGVDMLYVEITGGRHDYDTWAKVLPDFLQWAFPL
jgi:enterochelin esterase-like enzyme